MNAEKMQNATFVICYDEFGDVVFVNGDWLQESCNFLDGLSKGVQSAAKDDTISFVIVAESRGFVFSDCAVYEITSTSSRTIVDVNRDSLGDQIVRKTVRLLQDKGIPVSIGTGKHISYGHIV